MSTSSVVVGLVGGGVVGTIAGGLLTTGHERVERRRDRMLEAAEAFIAAYQAYSAQLGRLSLAKSNFQRASRAPNTTQSTIDELEAQLRTETDGTYTCGSEFEATRARLLVLFGGGSEVDERSREVVGDLQDAFRDLSEGDDEEFKEVLSNSGKDVEAFARTVATRTKRLLP